MNERLKSVIFNTPLWVVTVVLLLTVVFNLEERRSIGRFQPIGTQPGFALDTKSGEVCFSLSKLEEYQKQSLQDKGIRLCADLR